MKERLPRFFPKTPRFWAGSWARLVESSFCLGGNIFSIISVKQITIQRLIILCCEERRQGRRFARRASLEAFR